MLADLLCPIGRRLYGEKVFLRRICSDDINEKYLSWVNDPKINQFSQRRGITTTLDELKTYVENNGNTPNSCILGIVFQATEKHIGNVMLWGYNSQHQTVEIGNLIGEPKYWGSGIAVDADRTILGEFFGKHGLRKVEIGNIPQNRAATFLSKQLGFSLEGRQRKQLLIQTLGECDVFRFGLLREEFFKKWPEYKLD